MKRFILMAAALVLSISAMTAQNRPEGQRVERPKQTTPKERAQMQTDRLQKELNLDEKQYKKVYKAILNREKEVANLMPQGRQGGMGPGGMGGMRPGGMGPGSGGVRPPEGMNGQKPRSTEMSGTQAQVKASREKCDKKIKKALSPEQYARYEELEEKRQQEMMDRMKNMRGGQNQPGGQRPPQGAPQQPGN